MPYCHIHVEQDNFILYIRMLQVGWTTCWSGVTASSDVPAHPIHEQHDDGYFGLTKY